MLGQPIWIVIDPAAGGPQSDYAVVSMCSVKGCVVVCICPLFFRVCVVPGSMRVERREHSWLCGLPGFPPRLLVAAVQAAEAHGPRFRGARHCPAARNPFINSAAGPALPGRRAPVPRTTICVYIFSCLEGVWVLMVVLSEVVFVIRADL